MSTLSLDGFALKSITVIALCLLALSNSFEVYNLGKELLMHDYFFPVNVLAG